MTSTAIPDIVERLAAARSVTVLTGAGISAESGVPTFRDPDGLWSRFRPEELASMDAFLRNPEIVQGWYAHRRAIIEDVQPNAGHIALAAMEPLFPEFTLVTQNVDGLHERAGSRNIVELHGNLLRNYCLSCHRPADIAAVPEGALRCTDCGGLVRPDVVWFGEMLPDGALEKAHEAAVDCDVFLSIGTSAVVYPAAGLPLAAARAGSFVVEINVQPSAIADAVHEVVLGPAGTILPDLLGRLRDRPQSVEPS